MEAAKEVATRVTFAGAIIAVVYFPILSLQGTEGKMFKPLANTVVFALVRALILTLTLIPALRSLLLSGEALEGRNAVMYLVSRVYRPVLNLAIRARGVVVVGAAAIFVLSALLFTPPGFEFVPQLDEGPIPIQPVRLRTVTPAETVPLVTAVERVIKPIPGVSTVFSRSGTAEVATEPMPLSLADGYIVLKPRSQWRPALTTQRLIDEMEDRLKEAPNQGYGCTHPIQMRFSELIAGVKADIGIKVFGEDLAPLPFEAHSVGRRDR